MRTLEQTERVNKTEEIREKIRAKVADLVPCLQSLPPEELARAKHLIEQALEDAKRKAGKLRLGLNGAAKNHNGA